MTDELDKLDIHNRQQLSALMDGELAPDEARFLLRRLQHDQDLSGRWERWQLCGDALRGQAHAPAPAGFAARVASVIAAEPPLTAATSSSAPRGRLLRWGSGALAASLAFVALFMARQQAPQEDIDPAQAVATTQSATDAVKPDDAGTLADAGSRTLASATATTVAVAGLPRRADARRGSATRTQQAGRNAARGVDAPIRAVAQAVNPPVAPANSPAAAIPAAQPSSTLAGQSALVARDPFSRTPTSTLPQSRPWPRSVLSPYAGGSAAGSLTTGYSTDSAARTFYPFDPATPQAPTAEPQR